MDIVRTHHVVNRQNFAAQANQILAVVPATGVGPRGLAFDGKYIWATSGAGNRYREQIYAKPYGSALLSASMYDSPFV